MMYVILFLGITLFSQHICAFTFNNEYDIPSLEGTLTYGWTSSAVFDLNIRKCFSSTSLPIRTKNCDQLRKDQSCSVITDSIES